MTKFFLLFSSIALLLFSSSAHAGKNFAKRYPNNTAIEVAVPGKDVTFSNVGITGLTASKCVETDANGNLVSDSALCNVGGVGGSPGGSDTQVQFNDGGVFAGESTFTYDKTANSLDVSNIGGITPGDASFSNIVIGEGTDSHMSIGGVVKESLLTTHGQGGGNAYDVAFHRHSSSSGTFLSGARSRGSEASEAVVQNDDNLFDIYGIGYDGTDYEFSSGILLEVDGVPGDGDMPGRIVFQTTPDGSGALVEAMRISEDQSVLMAGDLTAGDATFTTLRTETLTFNTIGTQTLTGNGQTIQHNNYPVVAVSGSVANVTETWNTAIADGAYLGQLLTLILSAEAEDTEFGGAGLTIILTSPQRAVASIVDFDTVTVIERFDLVWDGLNWKSTDGLSDNDWTGGGGAWASGNNNTASGFSTHTSGEDNTNSGASSNVSGKNNTNSDTYASVHGLGNNNSGVSGDLGGSNSTNSGSQGFVRGFNVENTVTNGVVMGRSLKLTGLNSYLFGINSGSVVTYADTNTFILHNLDLWLAVDSRKMFFGEGQDALIYYDGTNLIIDPNAVGSGKVLIGSAGTDAITAGDATFASINLADNNKLIFGDQGIHAQSIYNDGTDLVFHPEGGNPKISFRSASEPKFEIRLDSGQVRFAVGTDGSGSVNFNEGGGVTKVGNALAMGGRFNISSLSSTIVPLVIAGVTSQTANLFEVNQGRADSGGDAFVITKDGFAGINRSAAAYPLSFEAGLGDKISLYPTGDVGYGFGVQGGVLQIMTDSSTTRTGIGYGSSGAFTETLTVKGGNVGIGDTTPDATLDVEGSLLAGDATFTTIDVTSLTASKCVETDANGFLVSTGSACGSGASGDATFTSINMAYHSSAYADAGSGTASDPWTGWTDVFTAAQVGPTGGTVIIDPGEHTISSTLTLTLNDKHLTILGSRNAQLDCTMTDASDCLVIIGTDSSNSDDLGPDGLMIDGLWITSNASAGDSLIVRYASDVSVQNVWIEDAGDDGLEIDSLFENGHFQNIHIKNPDVHGIQLIGTNTSTGNHDITLNQITVEGAGTDGIHAQGSYTQLSIIGGSIEDNGDDGIDIEPSTYTVVGSSVVISGVAMDSNVGHAIEATLDVDQITITNCVIQQDDIYLQLTDGFNAFNISDNQITWVNAASNEYSITVESDSATARNARGIIADNTIQRESSGATAWNGIDIDDVIGFTLTGNLINNADTALNVESSSQFTIANNSINAADVNNLIFNDADYGTISGNMSLNSGVVTSNPQLEFVSNNSHMTITGNLLTSDQGTAIGTYGIEFSGSSNSDFLFASNDVAGNLTGTESGWSGVTTRWPSTLCDENKC